MATLKLAVVDDEPGIRSGIMRTLRGFRVDFPFMEEHFEFELFEAATGEEAKALVDTNPPDIMLLDNKLPGIQGTEVLEYINKKQLDIIVVMITSYASLEVAVQATRDGAFDFIPKPFTPQELKNSIEHITKRVYLKKMTRKMVDIAKQIRFQFLSVLSHELKTPLNAIEGYLQMIKDREFGENIAEYDSIIEKSLKRIEGMRSLILDLLDLTKIQSVKKQKNKEDIDVRNIAVIAMESMRPYAIQKNISFLLNSPDNIKLSGVTEDLEIVLNNLVSNAVKYNKPDGKVEITITDSEHKLTISIKDNGIGIKPENLETIFQDFVRIKDERTKDISGTGLGLAIVKKIIDDWGGKIEVSSEIDKGSEFIIHLPK